MNVPDLAPLTERFELSQPAWTSLEVLARLLATDPLAPTTVRDPAQILNDHLADSLVALALPEVVAGRAFVDIGAGAGLPGLVLAAACPDARVVLAEANGKKCAWIALAIDAMNLSNAEVIHARAEEMGHSHRDRFDIVTARALAPLDVVAEYAAPLLVLGGHLVAWRGNTEPQAEAEALSAAKKLGLCAHRVEQVHPYPAAERRYLHLMSKVSPTPDRFPRRTGMARKRPLGSPGNGNTGR